MAFIYFQDVSFEFNNKLREAFSWKSKQWLFTFCHKNVLVSIWRNFLLFFFSRRTQRKNWRMEEAKTKQKVKELETNIWYWRKSRKKNVMNNFFIYYITTTTTLIKKKSLQAPFFVKLGHTPNIFRLILCTNILQEDSDWSKQFQFPPIKFQEISRYSQMNQWEARSRTTIHFFKIFRLWPSNL